MAPKPQPKTPPKPDPPSRPVTRRDGRCGPSDGDGPDRVYTGD